MGKLLIQLVEGRRMSSEWLCFSCLHNDGCTTVQKEAPADIVRRVMKHPFAQRPAQMDRRVGAVDLQQSRMIRVRLPTQFCQLRRHLDIDSDGDRRRPCLDSGAGSAGFGGAFALVNSKATFRPLHGENVQFWLVNRACFCAALALSQHRKKVGTCYASTVSPARADLRPAGRRHASCGQLDFPH